jgi:hypothetical protein
MAAFETLTMAAMLAGERGTEAMRMFSDQLDELVSLTEERGW